MTRNELRLRVEREIKGLADSFDTDDYNNAIDDMVVETVWVFPLTSAKILIAKDRVKRHLYSYLLSEASSKFKIQSINLNQKFDHYRALIKDLDGIFEKQKAENPELFPSSTVHAAAHFGHYAFDTEDGTMDFEPKNDNA